MDNPSQPTSDTKPVIINNNDKNSNIKSGTNANINNNNNVMNTQFIKT